MKNKMLIIASHLSTGGAPQFTLNRIELLKDDDLEKVLQIVRDQIQRNLRHYKKFHSADKTF